MNQLACWLLMLTLVPGGQKKADPPAQPDIVIHLPPAPKPPDPQPPAPGSPVVLPTGKLLLVTSPTVELFFKWAARDGSEVSIKAIKTPATIFGDFIDPQPGDDDGRTVSDLFAYIVRAKTPGQGTLVVVPSGVKAAGGIASQPIDIGGTPPNPVTVTISPTTATVQVGGKQQFVGTASQGGVTWKATGAGTVDQNGLFTAAGTSGSALIAVASVLDPTKSASATVTVTDQPDPPIPGQGLRVLMVYDKQTLGKIPVGQHDALFSRVIRDYMDAHGAKAGGMTEFRCFDQAEDTGLDSPTWQNAMKRSRKSLPWIIVSNGKTGTEQPLPDGVTATLELIRKYGE